MSGPDFSSVDSLAKAVALAERGVLEKMQLLPQQFGGDDAPHNVVYVPIGIGSLKAQTDQNVVAPLAAQGKVTRYAATPQYEGVSFVPSSIKITATDPGDFSYDIAIWGKALERRT